MSTKCYVTMTDKFMSRWGRARYRKNKLVFECDTYEEAVIVRDNAKARSEQKNVRIRETKPYYDNRYNYTQYKDKTTSPKWYEPGAF